MLPSSVTGWVHGMWEGRNWSRRGQREELGCGARSLQASADVLRALKLRWPFRVASSWEEGPGLHILYQCHWVCAALGEKCFEDRVECVTMDTTFSWILAFGLGGKEGDKLVARGPWGLQWTVIFNRRSLGVVLVRRRDFMGYCWGRCLQAGCLSEA